MRKIVITSLLSSVLAFLGGYFIASEKNDQLLAQHDLRALMHYAPALAYLRRGQVDDAKYMLYVGADDSIGFLSENNAAALNQEDKESLKNTLGHLNQFWEEDKPFDGVKSASLQTLPGWNEMRQKNDAFRKRYVNEK